VSSPIFISYSSKDQKIALTICRALEGRGYKCWIAARDVSPGENFQEAIVKALRSAGLMLLVFTANANNSDEIKKEIVLAGRHHVTVVPVRVEDVVPNDALAYEFATRQWIDLFTDWEHEIERLVSQIGEILKEGAPGNGVAAPEIAKVAAKSPPRSRKRWSLHPLLLIVPVVAIGAAVGGTYLYTRPPNLDGSWRSTIVCSTTPDGIKGYTLELAGQVKDRVFHGETGTSGQPAWLSVDGKIELDGSAELYAQGLSGDPAASRLQPGTPYSYHVLAKFDGRSAIGSRRDQRPCNFTAIKV
jgi:hypothetical protein